MRLLGAIGPRRTHPAMNIGAAAKTPAVSAAVFMKLRRDISVVVRDRTAAFLEERRILCPAY
jgi:hypothetical protein